MANTNIVPFTPEEEPQVEPKIDGNVYVLRQETYFTDRPFTEEQRADVGERMADALRRKSSLEDELDDIRKGFNTDIKAAEKDAMTASREWCRGKIDTEVLCEVLADYTTMEIIAVDIEPPHDIVNRRPMTGEERNKPLPGLYSNASYTIDIPDSGETSGEIRH